MLVGLAMLVVGSQVASKAARDAAFLSVLDASALPSVTLPAAVASFASVWFVGRRMASIGPTRLLPRLFVLQTLLYGAEWWLTPVVPEAVVYVLYVHVAMLGSLVVSGFWSFVSERVTPHRAKRVLARVGVGSTFGGVLGGLAVLAISRLVGPRESLLGLAIVNAAVAIGLVVGLPRSTGPDSSERTERAERAQPDDHGLGGADAQSAGRALFASPYLRLVGVLTIVVAVWESLIDFGFKHGAEHAFADPEALIAFFGLFYTGTSVATFLLQTFVSERVLTQRGIGAGLAALPLLVLLGIMLALSPWFAAQVLYRGAEVSLANSLFRTSYEVLFVPVPRLQRRATKLWLDVLASRVGDALGAGLVFLCVLVDEGLVSVWLVGGALGFVGIAVAMRVVRGYMRELERAVREGAVSLPEGLLDATTRTITESLQTLDTRRVLEEVARLKQAARAVAPPVLRGDEPDDEVLLALGHPGTRHRATLLLEQRMPGVLATLVARLGDRSTPVEVRARLPALIASRTNDQTRSALLRGLSDDELDVRYQCARALARIAERSPGCAPPAEVIDDAILRETRERGTRWADARILRADRAASAWVDRADRSLAYVASLLALRADPERVWLAVHALTSEDETVRSSALELLEASLPDRVRGPLLEALGRTPIRRTRGEDDLVRFLLESRDGTPR